MRAQQCIRRWSEQKSAHVTACSPCLKDSSYSLSPRNQTCIFNPNESYFFFSYFTLTGKKVLFDFRHSLWRMKGYDNRLILYLPMVQAAKSLSVATGETMCVDWKISRRWINLFSISLFCSSTSRLFRGILLKCASAIGCPKIFARKWMWPGSRQWNIDCSKWSVGHASTIRSWGWCTKPALGITQNS